MISKSLKATAFLQKYNYKIYFYKNIKKRMLYNAKLVDIMVQLMY
jgi:hypothetical protein